MNAEELRRLQAPIKARYKQDPAAAKQTFRAVGTLLQDRPACRIESRFGDIDAGLHPAAGGDGDFRGTLGVDRDIPVGVTDIRVRFEIDSPASDEQLAMLMKLTERYCVILQTLRAPPAIEATLQRVSA
jgi:OsmC-like protein